MKTFILLGMHRSATSLVSKGLANEIHMGENLMEPASDNPQGFFENLVFVNLNDKILKAAGGSWHIPPTKEGILKVRSSFEDEIKDTIAKESKEHELWGWKDPRTALTIDLYYPYLINPHLICIFREPLEVAKSLKKRNRFSIEKGINLANIYNTRIIQFISKVSLEENGE